LNENGTPHPPPPPPPHPPPLLPAFRDSEHWEESQGKVKNVTIRGIDAEAYSQFSKNMKLLGMTMGDAITKMMQDVLKDFDETFPDLSSKSLKTGKQLPQMTIANHEDLTISAKDLIEADAYISFLHIEDLELKPDITRELFLRHIKTIAHCDDVRIPSVLPKLLVYSRIIHCDDIELYEVENLEEDQSSD